MHSAMGTAVRMICMESFAFSTCHGVTGMDCMSHRLFPSSDTEGAVISFMEATPHRQMDSITGTLPSRPSSRVSTVERNSPPFHRISSAQTGIRNVPRPQLSI